MHENRETSGSSRYNYGQDRSEKAIRRTAGRHVSEESDCAIVPVNLSNKEGQTSAEMGEGRAPAKENIVQSHTRPTQSGKPVSQRLRTGPEVKLTIAPTGTITRRIAATYRLGRFRQLPLA